MFFCESCSDKNGWNDYTSIFKSYGSCEVCGNTAECNDVPSKYLPMPQLKKVTPKLDIDSIT